MPAKTTVDSIHKFFRVRFGNDPLFRKLSKAISKRESPARDSRSIAFRFKQNHQILEDFKNKKRSVESLFNLPITQEFKPTLHPISSQHAYYSEEICSNELCTAHKTSTKSLIVSVKRTTSMGHKFEDVFVKTCNLCQTLYNQ